MRRIPILFASVMTICAAAQMVPRAAHACGCFAPPDPANPVLQAGERILFQASGGKITMIIQIQYQGDAKDFGWLLPLPALPTLEVSTDEVFARLQPATDPSYYAPIKYVGDNCWGQGGGGFSDLGMAANSDGGAQNGGPNDPLVIQGGIGPYDYAVLKADDKTAMLDWLMKNRYFVPAGTDQAVVPYIRPGAYFLALKLASGQSAGEIQPIVLRYASDLPMIPIILTSVTAAKDMPVWAWVLGGARAVPRNFHHVVLDDAALAWPPWAWSVPANYAQVVRAAVQSAPKSHAFVTELAGRAAVTRDAAFPKTLYANLAPLATEKDAARYLRGLFGGGFTPTTQLIAILQKYIKQPPDLKDIAGNVPTPVGYFVNFDFWYRVYPQHFMGFDLSFDAAALTAEIDARIAKPVRDAAALFDASPWLTRLHTRLDPTDMSADPVFAFNADLPEVPRTHEGAYTVTCMKDFKQTTELRTEQGFCPPRASVFDFFPKPGAPAALRLEVLREAGPPEVVFDKARDVHAMFPCIQPPLPDMRLPPPPPSDLGVHIADMGTSKPPILTGGACSAGAGTTAPASGLMALLLSTGLLFVRRRRR